MRYINNPDAPVKTYKEVSELAIKAGVEPQRVYMYLAALGVKGLMARIMTSDKVGYRDPVKLAANGEKFISVAEICDKCGSLHLA